MATTPTAKRTDLVGVGEIAEQVGMKSSAVWNWVKRHEDFPEPFVSLACGDIWLWPDVKAWLKATGRTTIKV